MLEGGLREFDSGPPGRSVRHHTDVVDRLDRRSRDDEDTHVLKVPRPKTSEDPRDDRLHVRHLRLVPSRFASTNSTPSSRSRRMFAAAAGLSTMDSWAAGARRIGMPEPRALAA